VKRKVFHFITALLVLSAAAIGYRGIAAVVLRPPPVEVVSPRPPTSKTTVKTNLGDLFPDDAWQLGNCKRLLTSNGALLFQNWHQTSDHHWKLHPITVVVGRGLSDQGSKDPIVLSAREGAEIEFAESFDVMGGSAPPIKMGRMIGDVTIRRVGQSDGQPLSVQTRNVYIDNQKVWTTEDIDMRVGDAVMRGRDLTIHLAASATAATKVGNPKSILDRMKLVYLEEMRIPLDDAGRSPRPRRIGSAAATSAPARKSRGVVSIECQGNVAFDFALDRLTLGNHVSITRSVDDAVIDRFDCESLDLVLRDPADRFLPRNGPLDWVDKIRAYGNPAVLRLPTYDFELAAENIRFDALGGLLEAYGETMTVQLRRGPFRADLNRLAYQYDPDAPQRLGSIDAFGSGFVTISDPKLPLRSVRWNDGFRLQPVDQIDLAQAQKQRTAGQMGLRIDGDVQAKLADGGRFHADAVEGYLRPVVGKKTPQRWSIIPEEFHAVGAVSLVSSAAEATTQQLSLYFEQAASARGPDKQPKSDDARNQRRGFLDAWGSPPPKRDSTSHPVARATPKVSGNLVIAKLLLTDDQIQPKDLSIRGNVVVRHQMPVRQSMLPVEMTGQTLRMVRSDVQQSDGRDYVQLAGTTDHPATLKLGEGFFAGPLIKVSPNDNRVQVDGAGELKLPREILASDSRDGAEASPSAAAKPLDGSDIQWLSTPHAHWSGGLFFDGRTATLTGGVRIDARLSRGDAPWMSSLTGDQMQLVLSEVMNLSEPNRAPMPRLDSVRLIQTGERPVVVHAEQRSDTDEITGRHIITASDLVLNPADGGTLRGAGPGWYRGWLLSDKDASILPTERTPTDHLGDQVLQGVHLTFRESLTARIQQRTLAFTGGVRTGIRKLSDWKQVVEVAEMERLNLDESTLNCQTLQFGVTPGMPADLRAIPGMPTPWEMQATGGVMLRSRQQRGLVEITAARASYASRKNVLLVQGSGNRSATIKHTNPQGELVFSMPFPQLALNPKTLELEMQVESATFGNLPIGDSNQ